MIVVTALKWPPGFARGRVRDFRVRWALEEAGLPYRMRLIDAVEQASDAYRTLQPFGQVPALEDGTLRLFETGAILLHIAERAGCLLPQPAAERGRAIAWLFAALSSVEPFVMNLVEIDIFPGEKAAKQALRPRTIGLIEMRLVQVEAALAGRDWLAGGAFSIADMMMASVLRQLEHTDLLADFPAVAAHAARCLSRPAYQRAIADQCAEIDAHGEADMRRVG